MNSMPTSEFKVWLHSYILDSQVLQFLLNHLKVQNPSVRQVHVYKYCTITYHFLLRARTQKMHAQLTCVVELPHFCPEVASFLV